ncbi:Aim32 [Kluyveromyces lactis]|nr:Aim32 [Kluyveromyces lactis]
MNLYSYSRIIQFPRHNALVLKRLFHRPYQFKPVPDDIKNNLVTECECFVKRLNEKLPDKSQLDISLTLPNKVPEYHKHVLMLSKDPKGWKHWPSKLEMAHEYPHSMVGTLKSSLKDTRDGSGVLVNELALDGYTSSETHLKFLVIPDMKVYEVHRDRVSDFALFLGDGKQDSRKKLSFDDFLKGPDAVEQTTTHSSGSVANGIPKFQGEPFHSDIAMVCGHYLRDARCGELAPLLIAKLNSIKPNLKTGIVSHFGGHKFAGNLIYYQFNGLNIHNDNETGKIDGLWLSKLLPQNLEFVFRHLDKDVILQDFYRGHMSTAAYT